MVWITVWELVDSTPQRRGRRDQQSVDIEQGTRCYRCEGAFGCQIQRSRRDILHDRLASYPPGQDLYLLTVKELTQKLPPSGPT